MVRPPLALFLVFVLLTGCALSPEEVFVRHTNAFVDGRVEEGLSYCSERLREQRSLADLELYYAQDVHKKAMQYLTSNLTFQILEQSGVHAVARVVWSHGLMENAYFIKENGAWRIDLPPQ